MGEGSPFWDDESRLKWEENIKMEEKILKSILERFVSVTSSTAARIFNIWPQVRSTFDPLSFSWVVFMFFFGRKYC